MAAKTKKYDPYSASFPRGKFCRPLFGAAMAHPLERANMEAVFRKANPEGYHHDLGALDVFLDNHGMLFMDQFGSVSEMQEYRAAAYKQMQYWYLLGNKVIPKPPYWGKNYNIRSRDANSGEPRSIIRFMDGRDWSKISSSEWRSYFLRLRPIERASSIHNLDFGDLPYRDSDEKIFRNGQWRNPWDVLREMFDLDPLDFFESVPDWNESDLDRLVPDQWKFGEDDSGHREQFHRPDGLLLPKRMQGPIDSLDVLSPKHSTPDLPLRVGCGKYELGSYRAALRDQGNHKTCGANAVASALEIALRRRNGARATTIRFSPAALHIESGLKNDLGWDSGRTLKSLIELIDGKHWLPCSETILPYESGPQTMENARKGFNWRTGHIESASNHIIQKYGGPIVEQIDIRDIAAIKRHLAAGWVVVIGTAMTWEMKANPGFMKYGIPLNPLIGQQRRGGHAWVLVGYDHVDGNNQWKYQGRFVALNSWGRGWPVQPMTEPGLGHIPFSMLLTEGIRDEDDPGAYAIRFA